MKEESRCERRHRYAENRTQVKEGDLVQKKTGVRRNRWNELGEKGVRNTNAEEDT